MLIRKVLVEVYDKVGRNHTSNWLVDPDWPTVEQAVRAMDRFRRPFVWFYRDSSATEGDVPDFEIIGGNGAYAMQCNRDGEAIQYFDRNAADDVVQVWESDQGGSMPGTWICTDLERVVVAAHHFCVTGELDKELPWVSWESIAGHRSEAT